MLRKWSRKKDKFDILLCQLLFNWNLITTVFFNSTMAEAI